MSYPVAHTIYAFQNEKMASLWFDYIIPLDLVSFIEGLAEHDHATNEEVMKIFPPRVLLAIRNRKEESPYADYLRNGLRLILAKSSSREEERTAKREFYASFRELIHRPIEGAFAFFGNTCSLGKPINTAETTKDPVPEISIALSGLRLIDEASLSWDHIVEFRNDAESVRKLRRLRLFLFDNYAGKPANYIKDDLLRRVDEYENTISKWGMKTTIQTLQCVCSSKSIPAAGAATIVACLGAGMPLTVAIGALFEIGQIGLTVVEQRRELGNFRKFDPVSYLVDVKHLAR